jgi:hypothetical protein
MMLLVSSVWFETAQRLFPFSSRPCWQAIRQGEPAKGGRFAPVRIQDSGAVVERGTFWLRLPHLSCARSTGCLSSHSREGVTGTDATGKLLLNYSVCECESRRFGAQYKGLDSDNSAGLEQSGQGKITGAAVTYTSSRDGGRR